MENMNKLMCFNFNASLLKNKKKFLFLKQLNKKKNQQKYTAHFLKYQKKIIS